MSRLLSKRWILLLLPLSGAAFFLGGILFFYRGSDSPPPSSPVGVEETTRPTYPARGLDEAPALREGVLLVDNIHANSFDDNELSILLSRVADRGYTIEFMGNRNFSFFFSFERLALLKEKLPAVDSLAVVLPRVAYTGEEIDIVRRFVDKGGRLLLIGDPGRPHNINGISDSFGVLFQPGYLYNMIEHDLNFRNIVVKNFHSDQLTQDLREVALYTAGSVKSSGVRLALTDHNTYSSMVERFESFAPVVKSGDGRVLAIADFTFLVPPYNSTLDNDRFISNIADFLTTGERKFDLSDFPHLFQDKVDILLGHAALFDLGTQLKSLLSAAQISSEVRGLEDLSKDTIFLGLYQDASAVAPYLAIAGVETNGTIRTSFTPDIATAGTVVLLLHSDQKRWVLVILGDSQEDLADMVKRLGSGAFRSGLVSDFLGVYQVSSNLAQTTPTQGE